MKRILVAFVTLLSLLVVMPMAVHAMPPPAHSLCMVFPGLCVAADDSVADFALVVQGVTITTSIETEVPPVAISAAGKAQVAAQFSDRSGKLPATTTCTATRTFVPSSASFTLVGASATSPWDADSVSWGPSFDGTLEAREFPAGKQLDFVVKLSVSCPQADGPALVRTAVVTFTRDEPVLPPIDVRVDEVTISETSSWDSTEAVRVVTYNWAIRSEPEACSVVAADADTDFSKVTTTPDWMVAASYYGTPDANGWVRGTIEARYQIPASQGGIYRWKPILRCTDSDRLGIGYKEASMGTVSLLRGVKPGTVSLDANPKTLLQTINPDGRSLVSWAIASDIDRSTCSFDNPVNGGVYVPSISSWQKELTSGGSNQLVQFAYPTAGKTATWRFTLTCMNAAGETVASTVSVAATASGVSGGGAGKVLNYGVGGTRF